MWRSCETAELSNVLAMCLFSHYPSGYVYLVFELDKSVRALLQDCTEDLLHPEGYSEYYFKMSSRRMRCKDVRWVLGVDFVACVKKKKRIYRRQ